MSSIVSTGSALPSHRTDNIAIHEAASYWLKDSPHEFELFKRFLSASHTEYRNFIIPPLEVVKLGGQESRSQLFEAEAPKLASEALKKALSASNISADELDGLIFTSCSCPLIPSIDTLLIDEFKMRPDILRIPAYQFGCAGGVIGLGLAHRLLQSLKNIAVVSTELCSLVFQPSNHSASHLVGAALFGDGAAATILSSSRKSRFEIIDHQSYLIPKSSFLMGYDIRDTGSHLRLDKQLPAFLVEYAPRLIDQFLTKHSLHRADVPWWLFHPGSSKILAYLDEILGLQEHQSIWSKEVLRSSGNLSSATILMVIEEFLKSDSPKTGDYTMTVGIGPGLTIEIILGRIN